MELLRREGYPILDLSENEMAKDHVRYMVGGRAPLLRDEVIYRFEFPERPGALLKFLESLAPDWNISLFHYRNHGATMDASWRGSKSSRRSAPGSSKRWMRSAIPTGTRARIRPIACFSPPSRDDAAGRHRDRDLADQRSAVSCRRYRSASQLSSACSFSAVR